MGGDREDGAGSDMTRFLRDLAGGGGEDVAAQMPRIYQELRAIAEACLRDQRPGHTLQPTALVNEAYLKIFDRGGGPDAPWTDRRHFFALAARAMRQLLVDHARARARLKRGGGRTARSLDEAIVEAAGLDVDLLDLDAALAALAELDERQARVVELRYFGGLEVAQVARVLDVSPATVDREWRSARAWLGRRLAPGRPS